MNIYVGNIPRGVTENELRELFQAFGEITSASVIKDKFSGESRGFGFVEMPNKEEGSEGPDRPQREGLQGSALTVNEARPRTDKPRTGGFGGGGGRRY